MLTPDALDARTLAAVHFIGSTGAEGFQVRYQDDEQPVVWIAVATYSSGLADAAASIDPNRAVLRLAKQVTDGGICTHCSRATAFDTGEARPTYAIERCWYAYDPEHDEIRRSCL